MPEIVLQQEKITQAIRILNELQLDCWLIFVRETDEQPDPAYKLVVNHDVYLAHCISTDEKRRADRGGCAL